MSSCLLALWLVVLMGGNPVTLTTGESEVYPFRLHYFDGKFLSVVPIASSDSKLVTQLNFGVPPWMNRTEYTPSLACFLDKEHIGDVYIINCAQNMVFSSEPGEPDYVPLWRTHPLEYADPSVPHAPFTSEAAVLAAIAEGVLVPIGPMGVLNATIIINTDGEKTVKTCSLNFARKTVSFPAYKVFYKTNVGPANVKNIIITDISDPVAAGMLGANVSPGLALDALDCCGRIDALVNPVPPGQYPIINEVPWPHPVTWLNTNKDYNTILCWNLYDRGSLSPSAIINNMKTLDFLVGEGVILPIVTDPIVSNSPVVKVGLAGGA